MFDFHLIFILHRLSIDKVCKLPEQIQQNLCIFDFWWAYNVCTVIFFCCCCQTLISNAVDHKRIEEFNVKNTLYQAFVLIYVLTTIASLFKCARAHCCFFFSLSSLSQHVCVCVLARA